VTLIIAEKMILRNFIKTDCGLEKYELLKSRKGLFSKLRFYWFIVFASIRDTVLKKY